MTTPLNVEEIFLHSVAAHNGMGEERKAPQYDVRNENDYGRLAEQMVPGILHAAESLRYLVPGLDRVFTQGIERYEFEGFCLVTNIKPGHHPDLVEPDFDCVFVQIKPNGDKEGRLDMTIYKGKEIIILERLNFTPDQILRIMIEDLSDLYNEQPAEAPNLVPPARGLIAHRP